MGVIYQAEFQYSKGGEELSLTRTLSDGSQDTSPVNLKEISELEEKCRDYKWNQSKDLSQQIGERLFSFLNGDRQTLIRALEEADNYGECLQFILRGEGTASNLPFELLYHNDFLVPSRIHLIRRVSDRGKKKTPEAENRPLKILLMACSPQDVEPVLEFEKEEDTIFEVTKDLPIEIDVEDTGSLEGLGERLSTNKYDVVHITGHADIDKKGEPFFWMEDEEGLPVQVTPLKLWEKLDLNLPRLVFLSGCRTGEADPEHVAAMSFAHQLVKGHIPTVLGWGLPVSDRGASFTAKKLYYEMSRGENIPDALLRTRRELSEHYPDWSILRLFSDGTPLDIPLIKKGQLPRPKPRELQYAYLESSQVRVLKKGFIGRRRQIQQGLRCLKRDTEKVGLLLHGTGGLGKSCLAGKFCERFKDHTLIIVHGDLNAYTFREALKDGFIRGNDNEGLKILEEKEEIPNIIRKLCPSAFQKKTYLILLDDFEKNIMEIKDVNPEICAEAVPIMEALLRFLPYSGKMTQLIITTRHPFSLTFEGKDLVKEKLESIGLTSFMDADERKKVSELSNIANYPNPETKQQLIKAGHGNPRLMETLNILVGEVKDIDVALLLSKVKDRQEEFVQGLVLRQLMEAQPKDFQTFLCYCAVYRLPVLKEGIGLFCGELKDWEVHIEKAVRLSLMEKDSSRRDVRYWVTPLLREDIFEELGEEERKHCHKNAVSFYQTILPKAPAPILSAELIEHALKAGLPEIAVEESGGRFLPYLRKSLDYREALAYGEYIHLHIPELKRNEKFSKFMSELGWIYHDIGDFRKAIKYYEQALSIDKEVYGERHPSVATILSNIGLAWNDTGEHKKAIDYFEQALSIDKEVYGDMHVDVAIRLNCIGTAWLALGEYKTAIDYCRQALYIFKHVYGNIHPDVAKALNNIGGAWNAIGEHTKAIEHYKEVLFIDKEVYGDRHPDVATVLNNIGLTWHEIGEHKKATEYCQQALSIDKEVYGDRHPNVARDLNNIGLAFHALGEHKKAIEYYEQALSIDKETYRGKHYNIALDFNNIGGAFHALGERKKAIGYYEQALSIVKELYNRHPTMATILSNIGFAWYALGDSQRAKEYFQQAYDIFREFYGDEYPHTRTAKEWLDRV
jgi:tetratricopeptide (TPR) repeat protein